MRMHAREESEDKIHGSGCMSHVYMGALDPATACWRAYLPDNQACLSVQACNGMHEPTHHLEVCRARLIQQAGFDLPRKHFLGSVAAEQHFR